MLRTLALSIIDQTLERRLHKASFLVGVDAGDAYHAIEKVSLEMREVPTYRLVPLAIVLPIAVAVCKS